MKNKSILAIMLATTMGFVNAGIFDDIEDDIGQVAKDAVHGTEVIAYKAFDDTKAIIYEGEKAAANNKHR
ncbi:hypothetical protein BSPLISOX_2491 [uncultured Gammaproteobacteria bacterium]|nr:hypothetical protein [uncultured Gammaproteobacteria bacterium]CAC9466479.1 hypothetical protein [uncultured Gammaproteobacteria bacterium]CAC9471037.1 hypothetical protein [uncultured Gammaproteobacteria bacterium]VVH66611.1 hypothetical protein BSPLISOX_2491 [uncultured Gammaproteobacteria bacterium]